MTKYHSSIGRRTDRELKERHKNGGRCGELSNSNPSFSEGVRESVTINSSGDKAASRNKKRYIAPMVTDPPCAGSTPLQNPSICHLPTQHCYTF